MMDHKVARAGDKSRGVRPDARIEKSRRALHSALIDLVAEMPFEEVTIAAITKRADIGYATFFRHYPTTGALLGEIADELIGQLLVRIAPLMLTRETSAAALALTRFVEMHRSLCQALLVGAGDAIRRDLTARAVEAARTAEAPAPDWLPQELSVIHAVSATLTVLRWWLEQDRSEDAEAVAKIVDRLVFGPIAA